MKKAVLTVLIIALTGISASAQRYAFVDTEHVMRNIPEYQAAQEQLEQLSREYQQEVEAIYEEVSRLYKNYQQESVFLSDEMRIEREEDIIQREREAKLLQERYFGPEGEMEEQQQTLIEPIQERVASAIREIARDENFAAVFDRTTGVLYLDPRHDISDQVLEVLGY
ncbi:OmpH family outer membrane protein [Marinilabiliaceae bacterium ANBcel2]|nr:OmpH family outer membrane protein [Marinilabiliaceae bacterium ANBcel2]